MNEPPSSQSSPPVHVIAEGKPEPRVSRFLRRFGAHRGKLFTSCFVAVIATSFGVDERYATRVPHGVSVLSADLSRLDVAEAKAAIQREGSRWSSRAVTVEIDGRAARLTPAAAGVSVDVERTAARAAAVDRERSVLAHFGAWVARFGRPQALPLTLRVDDGALEAVFDRIEREVVELPRDGGLRLEGDHFVGEAPRAGRRIDRAHARSELRRTLESGLESVRLKTVSVPASTTPEAVEGVVRRANALSRSSVLLIDAQSTRSLGLEPSELRQLLSLTRVGPAGDLGLVVDAAALERVLGPRRAALESGPVDARFVVDAKDQVYIEPSVPGTRIDARRLGEAILQAAVTPERRGVLPFAVGDQPALTTEGAEKLGIRKLLSAFTTRHACCERRVENIHRIAALLDGLVVKPGETVSVNAVVGPRTTKNGFVLAPTIEEGEMVDTVGGGISQFATTFFNALFYGGFDIVERQPHTYWFPRYPMGHEATLSYPKPDLVFRNDTEYGMLVDTITTKTSVTVRLFGDNGGRKVRAEVSARQNIVEPPVEILGNPEVLPDEEKVREAGMVGWTVTVGRILTFPDGTTKQERRKVTYRPRTRRVEVHPCRVPKGEKGYTGERCPQPEDSAEIAAASELAGPSDP